MISVRTKKSIRFLFAILFLTIGNKLVFGQVQQAWEALANNNRAAAETLFQQALQNEQEQFRAHLGLSFLYQLMENQQKSWTHYQKAIDLTNDPEPYIYTAMMTPRMSGLRDLKKSGVIDLYKKYAQTAKNSTLRAAATETIGRYCEEHNDLKGAIQNYANLDAITDWQVIGPFDNISASGFDRIFPPEFEMDTTKTYAGKNDIPVFWFHIRKCRLDHWIDFRRYFAQDESMFFANTFVYSPEKQTVRVRVGTSGAVKVFLNDEQILEWMDENNNDLDTYIAETELQAGWNRLLIKCGFSEINQCNFMARLTGPRGEKLKNVQIRSAVQSYLSQPGAPVRVIKHFAEDFFIQLIQMDPDHAENYLLLAECYLRNDKAIEAELVLRKALEKTPNSVIILHQLLEAYTRGEKYDEIVTALERMFTLDPMIPSVLDYKFDQAINNQDYDKAADFLKQLESILPEGPELMQYRISMYHAKDETEKVVELTPVAAKTYPDHWGFVQANAYISLFVTKSADQGIKSLNNYLKKHTHDNAFNTLMDFYLKAGNFKGWEKTAKKRMEFYPAAAGYFYDMSQTYKTVQNYTTAEQYIRKTIDICPQSALYWSALAEILRITDRNSEAVTAYEKALLYNPAFYDARDKLRELQDKPPVFDQFEEIDIDSLIRNAPVADKYPDDGAVIMLNDAKRVVYPRGTSESREEMLVRVFNPTGIDHFKEYWIGYNPYTEKLIVEKAVTIKPDGSEINADQDDNHIVFKTLEENDFVYLKWKIRNYYTGKLSNHFWDHFYFNAFYPIQDIRYAVLIPENFSFQYKTQFMSETPIIQKSTPDGVMYRWQLKNEPAIEYEYRMPGLDDIGKMLFITSIPDWAFIVDWYTDLAKTKTRSSYEIKEKVETLLGNEALSEAQKIQRIHHYITENVRYSFVPFRQSGLIPQKARDVLVNRIGDCKDMATLAIAMLKEAGITAHYVIVNTRDEGRNRNVLPSINFNHAIVNIETEKGPLYVDLTAQNYAVGTAPQGDMGAFALNIQLGVTSPVYLNENLFIRRELTRYSDADIMEDNSLKMKVKTIRTGSLAAQIRLAYRFMGKKEQEKTLIENLNKDFPNLNLNFFEIQNIDSITPDIAYSYEFTVPVYINDASNYKIFKLPWTDALTPDRALSYDQRHYAYDYWPYTDMEKEVLTIKLPEGYIPVELPAKTRHACSVAEYTLTLSHKDGIIQGIRIYTNKKWDVLPEEYNEFKTFYNQALKTDGMQILLKKKSF